MRFIKRAAFVLFLTTLSVVLYNSIFIVSEWKVAVVTQFGQPTKIILGRQYEGDKTRVEELKKEIRAEYPNVSVGVGPGFKIKFPFAQNVTMFDGRTNVYTAPGRDVVTRNKQKIVVDNYAVWRIENPQKFVRTVHDEHGATLRLDDFVYSTVRDTLGRYDLVEILRSTLNHKIESGEEQGIPPIEHGGRDNIIAEIYKKCEEEAKKVGIHIVDIRIRQTDLPNDNKPAVFARMVAERERISKKYRATGIADAEKVKAQADQEVKTIMAQAEQEAQTIRGTADATAANTYATAYSANKDFYIFLKSLETMEISIGSDTTAIINSDKGLIKTFRSSAQ